MVAFETLLLGIIFGTVPIRLMVEPPVAAVELRLDGSAVGVVHGPPWAIDCDLGSGPMPHELTAVGRDAAGREAGRVTQWINLGRERIKVAAMLERDALSGRPDAVRLAWHAARGTEPRAVTVTLDGAPLPVADRQRVPLPPLDLTRPHLVSAEVTFGRTLTGRADLAFGGDVADRAETELTSVAVVVPPGLAQVSLAALEAAFAVDGAPAQPVGVEMGRAEVVVVHAASVEFALSPWRLGDPGASGPDEDVFSVMSTAPEPATTEAGVQDLFRASQPMRLALLGRAAQFRILAAKPGPMEAGAVDNAVSIAGAEAAGSNHRRAVVLVLAGGSEPLNVTMTVNAVRAYLAAIHVPLVIWSLDGTALAPGASSWGQVEDATTPARRQEAADKLVAALASQRIVWFAGRHLPQRITLDESKTALRFAR